MHLPVKRYLGLLATYLIPQWRRVLLMAALLLAGIGYQFLNPQILKYFIDTALAGGASGALLAAGVLFIGLALVNQGISVAASALVTNVSWTATNQLRRDLVAHCLALDLGFHQERSAGELIERIDGDVDALSNFFSEFTVNLLSNALLLLVVLLLFFLIDWRVGVIMTAFASVAFLVLLWLRRRAIPSWGESRQMSATFYGFLGEHLAGTADIRANGATAYVMRRFFLLLRGWLPSYRKSNMGAATMGQITLLMFVCGGALAMGVGAYLWSLHEITVGTVYVLFAYTDLLSQPLQQIQTELQDLQQAEACIGRVEQLLRTTSALADGANATLPPGALSVEFCRVSFGYGQEEAVLRDLSFRLEPGQVLGVVGRTGSGKTTLARLLFRLYDAQAGEVRIGDVPVQQCTLHALRRRIGMVTQEVQLFHATLRENLTLFNASIADAHILDALEVVGLAEWYRHLPDGLDTLLGSDGAGLSAGEAQLLAFVRVLLTDPGLVILDEASSRLDPETERRLERAIATLFADARPL